ncbi:MAG: hypothetical protein KDB03_13740 [Planctomycetales bacterium]|nr:hypothetical protein [Planctomycetales bacterium]
MVTFRMVIASLLLFIPVYGIGQDSIGLMPYAENPTYWQYRGQPLLLLGGSVTDHLFLIDDLEQHLDALQSVGANYVRNTMSQREERNLKPHRLLPTGKFNLDLWNDAYWERFANFLAWTSERTIIVQIEVWDRFDFSQEHWRDSPWNPVNNVNYTAADVGLATQYPDHPSRDRQPFFHSIPGMPNYLSQLDRIRDYQEAFVRKMLSYSFQYDHVLYCMNNETSTPAAWGQYWIDLIRREAKSKGRIVQTTDMFDDAFRGDEAIHTPLIFNDAEHYTFADISQVNSRNFDETHWERVNWLLERVNQNRRPSNHVKIYGSGYLGFGTGGPEDGVERFWRNLLAGSAAVRFHREDSGNGFNDRAQASIKAGRLLEEQIKFWNVSPHMELLGDREPNEAYLAADPGNSYLLYFTNGGSVSLDLGGSPGHFKVTWISLSMGIPVDTTSEQNKRKATMSVEGETKVTLTAPYKGGWVAAIVRQ